MHARLLGTQEYTVGKYASFFVIFVEKGKRAPIPRVSINNLSFEPNLTNIFKFLVLKTIRQNSLIRLKSLKAVKVAIFAGRFWTVDI